MKDCEMSLLIIIVVFGLIFGFAADHRYEPYIFWPTMCIMAGLLYIVLRSSVFIIRTDRMVASYLLGGTYQATYISGSTATQTDRYGTQMTNIPGSRRGLFGLDFVVLLFPIWRGIILPTGEVIVRVHATRAYTKDVGSRAPSVPAKIDSTIIFRLKPNVVSFIRAFQVLEAPLASGSWWKLWQWQFRLDLTERCQVKYPIDYDPATKQVVTREYRGMRIAQVILDTAESTILEAIRVTASGFTWGKNDAGELDILGNRPEFEQCVKERLGVWESAFSQAGMVTEDGTEGISVQSLDINFEDIDVMADDVRQALGQPKIAALRAEAAESEARATARRGEGAGRAMENIRVHAQLTPGQALDMQVSENLGQQFAKTGGDLLGVLMSLMRRWSR